MPTDRLLRYSISGSTLLIFLCLFYFLYGGSLEGLIGLLGSSKHLFELLALIFATPFLGIMISMIGFQSFVELYGYRTFYYVPQNEKLISWILAKTELETDNETILREKLLIGKINDKEFRKKFYPYYQVKVRKHITGDSLSFLERKWAVIWIHRNIRVTLVMSLIAMMPQLIINIGNLNFDWTKLLISFFILVYLMAAHKHVKYSVEMATDFEHKLLMNAYTEEQKNLPKISEVTKKHGELNFHKLLLKLFKI